MVEWPIFTLRLWNPKGPKGDDHKVAPKKQLQFIGVKQPQVPIYKDIFRGCI